MYIFCLFFFVFHAGLHSPCPHNHLPVLPLCCNSDNLPIPKEKNDGFMEKEKKNEHERGTGQEKKTENTCFGSQTEQQQRFFPPSRGLFQGNTSTLMSSPGLTGSNLNMEISRRRIFSLEPFHQSSIINSRLKRGREEDREEEMEVEEGTENLSKKAKFTNGKNSESLHVCDFIFFCWDAGVFSYWLTGLDYRVISGRREEAEGLHRVEWPSAQQAPPTRGVQPMASHWSEISRGQQEVQNRCPIHQGEVRHQRRLVWAHIYEKGWNER